MLVSEYQSRDDLVSRLYIGLGSLFLVLGSGLCHETLLTSDTMLKSIKVDSIAVSFTLDSVAWEYPNDVR